MAEPTFFQDTSTGHVTIDWHGEEPSPVLIEPAALIRMLEDRNHLIDGVVEQERLIENLHTVLAIIRLGRRPNKADWESAQLPPLTEEVRIDLMKRKTTGGRRLEEL